MFAKLLITIIFATVTAAALLGLRQQRMQSMHDMARLHDRIDQLRRSTWDLQVGIAAQSTPEMLGQAIERSDLLLEPANTITPSGPRPTNWSARMVEVYQPRYGYPEQAIR